MAHLDSWYNPRAGSLMRSYQRATEAAYDLLRLEYDPLATRGINASGPRNFQRGE